MTMRQQWIVVGGVLAGLAVFLGVASIAFRAEASPVDVGSRAPAFRAHVLGAPTVKSLADYRGQVVLLNVWATWCEPCKVEMPSIERLSRMYEHQGFAVVAISADKVANDSTIAAYARNLGLTFEILHDSTGQVSEAFRTTGYPETFIIDAKGMIRRKIIGPPADGWDSEGNQALIRQLLGLPVRAAVADSGADAAETHRLPLPAGPGR